LLGDLQAMAFLTIDLPTIPPPQSDNCISPLLNHHFTCPKNHPFAASLASADLLLVVLLENFANWFLFWLLMSALIWHACFFDFHFTSFLANQSIPHIIVVISASVRMRRYENGQLTGQR
jgi:hypothetical protein